MGITRDDVVNDRLRQRLRQDAAEGMEDLLLSDAEFDESLQNMLGQFSTHPELWVFGYGSLIWNPTFEFVDEAVAQLPGHQRKFCLWAESGRGSVERPGLWLALDEANPASQCTGVAFRIDNDVRQYELMMLWRREMVTGAYVPVIRPALIDGELKPCLCLLANKAHHRYASQISEPSIIESIAMAEGYLGTCRDYLFNLVGKLESLEVVDAELHALADQVRRYRAERALSP